MSAEGLRDQAVSTSGCVGSLPVHPCPESRWSTWDVILGIAGPSLEQWWKHITSSGWEIWAFGAL